MANIIIPIIIFISGSLIKLVIRYKKVHQNDILKEIFVNLYIDFSNNKIYEGVFKFQIGILVSFKKKYEKIIKHLDDHEKIESIITDIKKAISHISYDFVSFIKENLVIYERNVDIIKITHQILCFSSKISNLDNNDDFIEMLKIIHEKQSKNEGVQIEREPIERILKINDYDNICKMPPPSQGTIAYAEIQVKIGSADKAIVLSEKALKDRNFKKSNIDYIQIYSIFSQALVIKEDYDKAQEVVDEALENKLINKIPKIAKIWNIKGIIFDKLEKFDNALESFKKARKLDLNYIDAIYNEGIINGRLGNHEEAYNLFKDVIKINPKIAKAYNNMGVALEYMGEKEFPKFFDYLKDAIDCYKKALKFNPNLDDVWFNLGRASYHYNKPLEEVIEYYDKAIELNKNNINAWINKAITLSKEKEFEEAEKVFNEALKIEPNNLDIFFNQALMFEDSGNKEIAMSSYRKVLKLDKNYYNALINLGRLLEMRGNDQDAQYYYNRANSIKSIEGGLISHKIIFKGYSKIIMPTFSLSDY